MQKKWKYVKKAQTQTKVMNRLLIGYKIYVAISIIIIALN